VKDALYFAGASPDTMRRLFPGTDDEATRSPTDSHSRAIRFEETRMRMFRTPAVLVGPLALLTAAAVACSSPLGPDTVIDEIPIKSIDIRILESFPPQATAHVEGILGDGCSEFHSLGQTRSGNVIEVTILRQRPRGAICTQIARRYAADIPLRGSYPPARYVLRVNGVEKTFSTE